MLFFKPEPFIDYSWRDDKFLKTSNFKLQKGKKRTLKSLHAANMRVKKSNSSLILQAIWAPGYINQNDSQTKT